MGTSKRYSAEVRERAARMVLIAVYGTPLINTTKSGGAAGVGGIGDWRADFRLR
jgi:hypothetical protein